MNKVWFVTETSKGFGRQFVQTALERGDQVAATARNVASLEQWKAWAPAAIAASENGRHA
ncbi:hypothetical protein CH292_26410 [Rhodococcus sp. 14-2470-1a]|nr:hypothetical protein CH292_26410 [Rhodococcus sp. 14-2470-1a]